MYDLDNCTMTTIDSLTISYIIGKHLCKRVRYLLKMRQSCELDIERIYMRSALTIMPGFSIRVLCSITVFVQKSLLKSTKLSKLVFRMKTKANHYNRYVYCRNEYLDMINLFLIFQFDVSIYDGSMTIFLT